MFKPPRIADLAAFMQERHNIYLRRLYGQPGPWTEDPVLQVGRFCNIFRELDTVTIWIDKHIRKPFANSPHLWFMLAIARYINWPPTLAELIETRQWPSSELFEPNMLTTGLEHRAARGEKVYTGAYMIRAESDTKAPWYRWSKHRYIAEIVLGRLWEDREDWENFLAFPGDETDGMSRDRGVLTLEKVWDKFQQSRYIGWGPFMAYEVVTDLRHTHYLNQAPDIMTWANPGPGAHRGLNRMWGLDLNRRLSQTTAIDYMNWIMRYLNEHDNLWPNFPRLEMRDIEHSLCEFDKYERVRLGEGKMRSKYDWRKAKPLATGA